jgi:ectoine hydroxylase-related dioxygenase (phytanoyl-CoA dioxygenase family)
MNSVMTDELVEQFHSQGYLLMPAVFRDNEIARMREEADFVMELVINSSLFHRRKDERLDLCETEDGLHMVRKIQPINDLSDYLSEISNDDRLLEPMRRIMGEEPEMMEEKLNYKQPLGQIIEGIKANNPGSRFPIHNDWAYYAAQNYPQTIISSAISLDDCTPDNGPLHIWPGTHKKHIEHESIDIGLEVLPGSVDPDGGVDVLVPAGSVMFFHSLLVHNSRSNLTPEPRRLMIYSHFPLSAGIGFDVRNGPGRLHRAPLEWRYMREKSAGRYQDTFTAPS